jgi:hypothetical protein
MSESLEREPSAPISNDERINQLTLELLLNNTHYRKYMSKAHPAEYENRTKQLAEFELYEPQISQLIMDLTDHYACGESDMFAPTREISDAFHAFVQTCIHYYKRHADMSAHEPLETTDQDTSSPPITHFSVKKQGSKSLYLENIDDDEEPEPKPPLLRRNVHDTFLFPSPDHSRKSSFAPSYTLRSYFKTETDEHTG